MLSIIACTKSCVWLDLVKLCMPMFPGGGGRGGRGGRGGGGRPKGGRDTTIIGKTVRVIQGPYKGYVGIIKDATDTTARVELHTTCKTISVDRQRLSIIS